MSTYSNANPAMLHMPPPNAAQAAINKTMNLPNGQLPPGQQQQQQPQQQQYTQMPENMNKFLPPTSANNAMMMFPPTTATKTNGPQQQPQQVPFNMLPPRSNLPAHLRPPLNNGPLTNGGESSATSSRTASPNVATLSGSMQNLNLQNGAQPPPLQQQQQIHQQQQQQFHNGAPPQPSRINNTFSTAVPSQQQQQQPPPRNMNFGVHQQQPQQQQPLLPPPTTTNMSQQPLQQQNQQQQYNFNNNNNNNNNLMNHNTLSKPPPPPMATAATTQRRPMYPQQQQTQLPAAEQPYSQVYHQTPPTQQHFPQPAAPAAAAATAAFPNPYTPGSFNGQPTTSPMQYQSQPPLPQQQQQPYMPQGGVVQQGFNRLWGQDTIDLMQNRHIMAPATLMPPKIVLHNQFHESINCSPNILRCTMAKIPESNALLQKSRLPLGILIHPFRDINSLPVIQCPSIVRCRLCRTYINPFVYFVDSKMWKCNLCYRVNELPEDFQYDPATKTYGDVTRRPEVRSSTIEFIAPSEYTLRPPQPAIYLFLFDVSIFAQQSGYLENVCTILTKHLDDMPGDVRTQVGFIAFNSQVHFYSMAEGYNQPHEMTLIDIDDVFLPRPDNLLVNLKECKELVKDLLQQLPKRFADTHDPGSAMGAALQVAYKLMQASGGRITVFQACLPNKGPGALEAREDPNNRSAKDVQHLNPATDFYKRYALECSGNQIAVDLFLLNQQYSDMATISGISKHSGGCVYHFPLYQKTKPENVEIVKNAFKRYLMRKIGFEAVMRIRCTRGLQVHTFHGNFFVRSTDLLSLPNVNPDAGYGMQISYEESLTDVKTICFQAALLYTNSEGERRIRVHTLCLPVTASLPEVMHSADTEAIVGLLAKMAVDRSITSNLSDARDAFINATIDIFNAFKIAQNLPNGQTGQLIAPRSLALLPLYILALLKHPAFRVGTSTRLDDRVYAMDSMKTLPLDQLMKYIYPEFYNIDVLFNENSNHLTNGEEDDEEEDLPEVRRLQLSAEHLDSRSIFLMDCGTLIMIYVGMNVPVDTLEKLLGVKSTSELPDYMYCLPQVNSAKNNILRRFMDQLNDDKPYLPLVQIIRDTSTAKPQFLEKLVDDRSESSLSYYEFLQHIRSQVK